MMIENISRLQRTRKSLLRGLTLVAMTLGYAELAWSDLVDFSGSKTGTFDVKYIDDSHYYDSTAGGRWSTHVVVVNQGGYTIDKLQLTQRCFGSNYGFNPNEGKEILTYEHSVTRENNLLSQQAGVFLTAEHSNLEGDTRECVYQAKIWILAGVVREFALGRGNRAIFFQGTSLDPKVSRWSDSSVSCEISDAYGTREIGNNGLLVSNTTTATLYHDYDCKLSGNHVELSNGVEVFQHCDYSGYSQKLQTGDYTLGMLSALRINNDDISSVKVPPGYEVQLFDRDNFEGTPLVLTSNNSSCLVDHDLNDKISSIKVRQISHRWTFDYTGQEANGSGLNASGSYNYTSTKVPIEGTNQKAIELDGVNNYVSIPESHRLEFGADDDFTVALWVKADSNQPSTEKIDNAILEKWSGYGGYPFVVRYMNQTGKIRVARYDGSNQTRIDSSVSVNDGSFHHIAFVKNGGTLKLYIDGVLDKQTEDKTTGSTENGSPLYLGMRGGTTPIMFKGAVDDLRIYGYAIPENHIEDLASHGKIQVYEHCNFNGTYASLSVKEYKLDLLSGTVGQLNNEISSVRIPKGMELVVYDYDSVETEESYQAMLDEYEENGTLPANSLSEFTSIMNGPTATFKQSEACLTNNILDTEVGTNWNDKISRIVVGK